VLERLAQRPTDVVLHQVDEPDITGSELSGSVERSAAWLASQGVRAESRVAIVLGDGVAFYESFLGSMLLGAIPVPINPLLSDASVAAISRLGGAELVVHQTTLIEDSAPEATVAQTSVDTSGFWLCTSGTSGAPKLVMHRHIDLPLMAQTYGADTIGVHTDDRCYSTGPLFHAFGLGNALTLPLWCGAAAVVDPVRPPKPERVARVLREFEPTLFFSVPTTWAALVESGLPDDAFSSVRVAVSAGEHLPARLFDRVRERFGLTVLDSIGSTEMANVFAAARPGEAAAGSVGRATSGHELMLLDEGDSRVTAGEKGHLFVKGPTMATGYWNDAAASRSTFVGEWLRTGDVGTLSDEGVLTYLGRSDDLLRIRGEWVPPDVVERVLAAEAGVQAVAVVAVPDGYVSRLVAYVVASDGRVDEAALEARCRRELPGYMRPSQFKFVKEMPTTASGKLRRAVLRRDAAAG
jgi:acyl-coenzyme A synthetase/AMP-(fatty) acid ligase